MTQPQVMSEYQITIMASDAIHRLYSKTAIDAGVPIPLAPWTSDLEKILEEFGNNILNLAE